MCTQRGINREGERERKKKKAHQFMKIAMEGKKWARAVDENGFY